MNHLVTSKDGITFATDSDPRSVAFDAAFAKHRTAAELRAHGDFTEVKSLDDLLAPAPRLTPSGLRIDPKRVKLTLIKGGKQ